MPSYLVETYLAQGDTAQRAAREERASSAAARLTRGTRRVRLRCSFLIPQDEICFFIFDAPSIRDAVLVARTAGLDPIRVVEAIASGKERQ